MGIAVDPEGLLAPASTLAQAGSGLRDAGLAAAGGFLGIASAVGQPSPDGTGMEPLRIADLGGAAQLTAPRWASSIEDAALCLTVLGAAVRAAAETYASTDADMATSIRPRETS